jgi:hypothetical protein
MTKAKFRQTRRHNAFESDPFKLLEKHHPHPHRQTPLPKKEDPTEDIDDIIKELEEKRSQKSTKELSFKSKPREKFYTEVSPKVEEEKDYAYKYQSNKIDKITKEDEHKRYVSNNYEGGFKKEKNSIFSYGFQPASFPSLIPNSIERGHFSGTPVPNTRSRGVNISLNPQKDPSNKPKMLFPAILPFRY